MVIQMSKYFFILTLSLFLNPWSGAVLNSVNAQEPAISSRDIDPAFERGTSRYEEDHWFDKEWWYDNENEDEQWFSDDWWYDDEEEYTYRYGESDLYDDEFYGDDHYYEDDDWPEEWWEDGESENRYGDYREPNTDYFFTNEFYGEGVRPENEEYLDSDWWEEDRSEEGYDSSYSDDYDRYYTADDWWD
ncbi:MAG: hypothetical protein CME31_20995 [Gimesia sp.]|uniref:Uncharacterized protein n=1 Tax=Gimesia maris TaxID=122 RepID=A0A3D3REW8_9PLAN|nr:hypothetical protein [Gimesia sp.]HCO26577.1 hypothetical protein [Gimesia maris]